MKIALIGAGQQGTSQGFAFASLDHVERVFFYDTNTENQIVIQQEAAVKGIALEKIVFASSIQDAVIEADVVGINTPMSAFKGVAAEIAEYAKEGAIIYDNGSGKVQAMKDIQEGLGEDAECFHYFGAHFFVGRAGTGPAFAAVDMYKDQTAAIMGPDGSAKDQVVQLFTDIGVTNVRTDLSAEDHDESLGLYSHHNIVIPINNCT